MVDETLARLPEQDVDFDMNEVVVEEKEVVDRIMMIVVIQKMTKKI